MKGLIGKKIGMTQIFLENGDVLPVTVIEAGPCPVLQCKTVDRDGYKAVQLGFEEKKIRTREEMKDGKKVRKQISPNKPEMGHCKKAGVKPLKHLKEFRYNDESSYQTAQILDVTVFNTDDKVDVVGITKGRGYSGNMRKYNHHGNRASHGVQTHREPGSNGSNTCPGRVLKNHKLPGQYGNTRVTSKNIRVVRVDKENNLILLHGAVPGAGNGIVYIKESSVKV